MEETKVILKYRRSEACWKCSDCDIENPAETEQCKMCGNIRTTDDPFIRAWRPEDERVEYMTASQPEQNTAEPIRLYKYNRWEDSSDDESTGSKVWLYVIVAVAIIALIVVFAQIAGNAAGSDAMESCFKQASSVFDNYTVG